MKRFFIVLLTIVMMVSPFLIGLKSTVSRVSDLGYEDLLNRETKIEDTGYELSSIPYDTSVDFETENYYGDLPLFLNEPVAHRA